MGSYGSGMCNPAPTSRRSLTSASCLQWPGAATVHTWPVATLMAVYRYGNSRHHSQPPACRRSPGIATGCRDWPLPPTAADWPARVGIGQSESGTWQVGAVSTLLRGIQSGCNAWRGARMDARWPAPALTTRFGSGTRSRAALGRYCRGIPLLCIVSPSRPIAVFCLVAVKIGPCGCGTWRADTACASSRAMQALNTMWRGVRMGNDWPVSEPICW